MKTYLDCFPCFVEQAVRASRLVTDDEKVIKQILDEVGSHFQDVPLSSTPPETGELGKPLTYVVRETPVINDSTMDDALESGLPDPQPPGPF
jgi:uncharacterized protein with ATP-grasp and redox domains